VLTVTVVLKIIMLMEILEHLDYLLKLRGQKSPYGYAAYSVSQLKEPLTNYNKNLREIKGVGRVTAQIIKEILETGRLKYLEKLLMN
jgi:DNA polymerase/3'-5' exonuclease PolX